MDDSMRMMMTIIDSIYDVVFGSCNAIDNPTRYYERPNDRIGTTLVGLCYAGAGHSLPYTRSRGGGGMR